MDCKLLAGEWYVLCKLRQSEGIENHTLSITKQTQLGVFKTVEVDRQGRVSTMASPEPMLAGGKSSMGFPESDNFPEVYPNPKLPKNFQQHEGSESIECDTVFGVLWFGSEPSPLEPYGGGATE